MGKCARVRITERFIREITEPGIYRDDALVGFGLRVTAKGSRSFVAETSRGGRFTIGSTSLLTVQDARARARIVLADMHEGKDVHAKRRAGRQRSEMLRTMLEDYMQARGVKPLTVKKYRGQIGRNLSDWLDRPVADITPQMVALRYEALLKRSVSEANGTMRVLRAVCRRAAKVLPLRTDGTPYLTSPPTDVLARGWKPLDRKTSRLDPDELPGWWQAVSFEAPAPQRALKALLLSGLRVNELLRLTWNDVDLPRCKLTIRDSKTGGFEKFIGPELAGWFEAWRGAKAGDLVFGICDLRQPLRRTVRRGAKRITPHDLRRTFLTFGERCGTPFVTLKRLVNHSTKGDVTLGYVHPSDDDLRHWAGVIERSILAAAEGGEVVQLRAAR